MRALMTASEAMIGKSIPHTSGSAAQFEAEAIARQVAGGALALTFTGTGLDQTLTVRTAATGLVLCLLAKRVSRDGRQWPWATVQTGPYSRDAWELWMTARMQGEGNVGMKYICDNCEWIQTVDNSPGVIHTNGCGRCDPEPPEWSETRICDCGEPICMGTCYGDSAAEGGRA